MQSRMFGIFHDAGYKGLYGGLGAEAIKARKRIPQKSNSWTGWTRRSLRRTSFA